MGIFTIERNDITHMKTDAIVNAANENLWHGGGVCGAIFNAAGPEQLQEACRKIGHCDTGDAVATPGFALPAKYIIHTVGPVWQGGGAGEEQLLYSCYQKSCELAVTLGCQSIAFPLISSGIYGYPKQAAIDVATRAIKDFLEKDEDLDVTLILFGSGETAIGKALFTDLQSFIDDHYVDEHTFERRRDNRPYYASHLDHAPHDYPREEMRRPREQRASAAPRGSVAPPVSHGDGSFDSLTTGAKTPAASGAKAPAASGTKAPSASGAAPKPAAAREKKGLFKRLKESIAETVQRKPSGSSGSFEASESSVEEPDFYETTTLGSSSYGSTSYGTTFDGTASYGSTSFDTPYGPDTEEPHAAYSYSATPSMDSLERRLSMLDESFSESLLRLIDERGMTDVEAYKRANVDRRLFSKIRSDASYRPKKTTALAFAVALRLNREETNDLLEKAGFVLSHSSKGDIIVEYYIQKGKYDIYEINEALFAFDQALLGGAS